MPRMPAMPALPWDLAPFCPLEGSAGLPIRPLSIQLGPSGLSASSRRSAARRDALRSIGTWTQSPADRASAVADGGASLVEHVALLCCGLSLMNRWRPERVRSTRPFGPRVRERRWSQGRMAATESEFAGEAHQWLEAPKTPPDVRSPELSGVIGRIAHLAFHFAFHFGASRHDRAARGTSNRISIARDNRPETPPN
jgi:hypothetical protein